MNVLFIEMKRTKGGVVSVEQKTWLARLKEAGQKAKVCKGFDEFKKLVDKFRLNGPE